MGSFIENLGMQIGGQMLGAGLGALTAKANDRRQLDMQRKLQDMQEQGNRAMMDYSYQKQYDLWQKTNYPEQMKQLKLAGLNPALMYGMGGGGGVTTGAGGAGVSGGDAPKGGGEIMQGAGMGLQLGMMQAQMKLMEAQANKANTEAKKIGGVDTKVALQTLENMGQQYENLRWDYELKKLSWKSGQLEYYIREATADKAIEKFEAETGQDVAKAREAIVKADIAEESKQIQLEQLGANLLLTKAEIALRKSGIAVNDQLIQKMRNDMAVALRGVTVQEKQQSVNGVLASWQQNYPGASQVLGRIFNDGIESMFKLGGTTRPDHYDEKGKKH